MFGLEKRVFISYFCCNDKGEFYFGNTSDFKTTKVTKEFLKYVEITLKDNIKVKELAILYWRYY